MSTNYYVSHVQTDDKYVVVIQPSCYELHERAKAMLIGLGYRVDESGQCRFRKCMPHYGGNSAHDKRAINIFLDHCCSSWDFKGHKLLEIKKEFLDANAGFVAKIHDLEMKGAIRRDFFNGQASLGKFLGTFAG